MTSEKAKTLIFSFDGTGNEPSDARKFKNDESISNVLKLHILMGGGIGEGKSEAETPSGNQQITHYYNGIGTRESELSIPLLSWIFSKIRKLINMLFSPKLGDPRRILRDAREDFSNAKYKNGDTLVVFGFSRGAALARKFASMILAENQNCEVSFLGVFDTVAAMGGVHRKGERISSDVVFENGTLSEKIKKAVHIVSLDEDRVPFTPTLINKDDSDPNRIREVWFPGVHSDIGGGYWFDGLSDTTLQFMIKECNKELEDRILIQPGNTSVCIDKLLAREGSGLSDMKVDDIAINPIIHGEIHRHSGLLAKMGNQEPRLVHVNDNDQPSMHEQDLPVLHYSVKERFEKVPDYRPSALRGRRFKLLLADDSIKGPICGISGLREN